ncbi:hypothetical protein JTB14_028776 [Gonioctena quinquepunctata]|nr:hypothetical protein JTB14_028776 [Gonioctena quinquepunctata]
MNKSSLQSAVTSSSNRILQNHMSGDIKIKSSVEHQVSVMIFGEKSNTSPDGAPDLGVSGNVVTRLTETVPKNMNHKIFFDNWFNNPNLQIYLAKNGLLPLGTVRLNRVPNSEMPTVKDLKKQGRGFIVERVAVIDNIKIAITTWFDNELVNMLSTYIGSEPRTTKRRYFRKKKEYKEIPCPQAVEVHNQHMGGVDSLDSTLGLYRIYLRSKNGAKKYFSTWSTCV